MNILKVARNSNQETVWQALYVEGKKQVEASFLDVERVCKIFNVSIDKEIFIHEEYADDITNSFPKVEDFAYLMDYTELTEERAIYMEDGLYTVQKIWQHYRPRGVYKTYEWLPVGGKKSRASSFMKIEQQRLYVAHWVTKFTVYGKEDEFVWEDVYNNNQCSLYKRHLLNSDDKVNI